MQRERERERERERKERKDKFYCSVKNTLIYILDTNFQFILNCAPIVGLATQF